MGWKHMPDGKEKYAAYLCSREWSLLKEAVRHRSGGLCERCETNSMDHVHHLTYARKYSELLEDLQACCKECHDFIHAKSSLDPAADRPFVMPFTGKPVKTFYLAGKITGTTWRDSIVDGWSEENHSSTYWQAFCDYEHAKTWAVVPDVCTCGGVNLHYAGPWWKDVFCHGTSDRSASPHGYSYEHEFPDVGDDAMRLHGTRQREVANAVEVAIRNCDLLFAWIDSPDCYGTIVEVGIATALGKCVVIAMEEGFSRSEAAHQMWLCSQYGFSITDKSPERAWRQFWDIALFAKESATDGTQRK